MFREGLVVRDGFIVVEDKALKKNVRVGYFGNKCLGFLFFERNSSFLPFLIFLSLPRFSFLPYQVSRLSS